MRTDKPDLVGHYNERRFARSFWSYFDTFVKSLESDLGIGVYDEYEDHCCLVFHPAGKGFVNDDPVLPSDKIHATDDGIEQ